MPNRVLKASTEY